MLPFSPQEDKEKMTNIEPKSDSKRQKITPILPEDPRSPSSGSFCVDTWPNL